MHTSHATEASMSATQHTFHATHARLQKNLLISNSLIILREKNVIQSNLANSFTDVNTLIEVITEIIFGKVYLCFFLYLKRSKDIPI